MKKNLFAFTAIVLIAFSFTSCKKESSAIVPQTTNSPEPIANLGKVTPEGIVTTNPFEEFSWTVGSCIMNGNNTTSSYEGNIFNFGYDNVVSVTIEDGSNYGRWSMEENNYLFMIFKSSGQLSDLNGKWKIARITASSIYLKIEDIIYPTELRLDKMDR